MRIATWNVNSITARLPRVVEWLQANGTDVLCLQETKVAQDKFPADALGELGYEVVHHGQGRWNGVAVISRVGIADVERGFPGDPGFPDDETIEARAIGATCGGVRVWSLYVPNGRTPEDPHYAYKLAWFSALTAHLAAQVAAPTPLAVVGDFNVAPTDADVWDPAKFAGATHVTDAERAAFDGVKALGLHDVFPRALKGDHPFTFWDYRDGAFHRGMGMRIDFVLANPALQSAVTDAYVDREARKGKGASDHAPVFADGEVYADVDV
ncbi:MAG: exodeoxyribonuclease III [Actinomycetia bacterium]|nr:exodeoxyribonuclease III [Actinomycetes bacterium]